MKRLFKLFAIFLFIFIVFSSAIKAECNDEELNEWATTVEPLFIENKYEITHYDSRTARYAYFITIRPYREDIRIEATNKSGRRAKGKTYYFPSMEIYGLGAYTNLNDENYTIEIYGDKGSACEGELLKKIDFVVPGFNEKAKDARCEGVNDLEICNTFSNSTKQMSDKEFNEILNQYVEDHKETTFKDILNSILSYGLFVVLPIVIVGLFYFRKIKIFKKQQKNR